MLGAVFGGLPPSSTSHDHGVRNGGWSVGLMPRRQLSRQAAKSPFFAKHRSHGRLQHLVAMQGRCMAEQRSGLGGPKC